MSIFRRVWPVWVLLLAGCAATPQSNNLLKNPPPELADPVELRRVPFFPQEEFHCGPASLATVLNASGVFVQPDDLVSQVYLPERQGSLQLELLAAARRHGRLPYVLRPLLTDVLHEIQSGYPVLVMQNLGTDWYPVWHYSVVVGYDLGSKEIVLRSGTEARHRIGLKLFERTWIRADRWAMVTVVPGQLSATMRQSAYLKTVLGFEEIARWSDAVRAYQAGLRRWPANKSMHMGLGNSLYGAGRLQEAIMVYRKIIQQDPEFAAAHNNLAQTFLDLGEVQNALIHAEKAVALGGKHAPIYRDTLKAVNLRYSKQPHE